MNQTTSDICSACQRKIDVAARVCPFCAADPATGERVDTSAILEEVFHPRKVSTAGNMLDYARQRQGVVIAGSALLLFVILAGLHQFATRRNAGLDTGAPAVPLTEITDVRDRADETKPVEMPTLDYSYDGDPRTMRTFIVEPGAVAPPEVTATQQQLPPQGSAQPAAAAPGPRPQPPPRAVQTPQPRPRS